MYTDEKNHDLMCKIHYDRNVTKRCGEYLNRILHPATDNMAWLIVSDRERSNGQSDIRNHIQKKQPSITCFKRQKHINILLYTDFFPGLPSNGVKKIFDLDSTALNLLLLELQHWIPPLSVIIQIPFLKHS